MKVAVVGIRDMGQNHVRAAQACKIVSQVAGCDVNEDLRKSVEKTYGIPTYSDLPSLLNGFKPDAVLVVTPPNRHAEVIRACFERSIAVLTEKPISSTLQDSEALVIEADKRKIPFQVGFEMRYCGLMRAFQSLLDSNALGKLSLITHTQFSGSTTIPGYMTRARTGGIFFEKLCHQVDLFRFMFGEPLRAMAVAAPNVMKHYDVHDNVHATYQFKDGKLGTITFNVRRAAQVDVTAKPERSFEGREAGHYCEVVFSGDAGAATFDAWTECIDVVKYNHRADCKADLVRRINVREEFGEPSYDVATQDADFFQLIAAKKPLRYPASDALKSMFWSEIGEESLRRGGDWVS
jgi:predicted dehydrogenase